MALLVGSRVVRGPDWEWGDQDGGDGHLGTISSITFQTDHQTDVDGAGEGEVDVEGDVQRPNGGVVHSSVKVTWDTGKKGNYRAGFDGKYDLRLYDNAPAGVRHKFERCVGCSMEHISGIRWKCTVCVCCNLCSECYMADSHETDHEFLRMDDAHSPGIVVGTRQAAKGLPCQGLLAGATVSRGPNWTAGNEDGGKKSKGTVSDVCDWSVWSRRSAVLVQWKDGDPHKYCAGHDGRVEVKAVEAATGLELYLDHLPKIGEVDGWLTGDKVMVAMDTDTLKTMPLEDMDNTFIEKVGVTCTVETTDERGWVRINYGDGTKWIVPPFALKKSVVFWPGDLVRLSGNTDLVQELQSDLDGWTEDVAKNVGQEGKVLKVSDDCKVIVEVSGQSLTSHPATLTLIKRGERPRGDGHDEENDNRAIIEEDAALGNIIKNDTPHAIRVDVEMAEKHLGKDKTRRLMKKLAALGGSVMEGSTQNPSDEKRMVRAAANGQQDTVKELLKQNPKLASASRNGKTALQLACHEAHLPVVQLLVEANASLEEKDNDGDTALSFAVIGNNPSIVEYLLEKFAYVNTINARRRTPLHIAVHTSHRACAEILLKHGASTNMQDNDGSLPLHLAIRAKNTLMLAPLINHTSSDLRLRNNSGFTPLHYASKKGHAEAVKMLVARDASLCSIQKHDGYTPLHLAAVNDHVEIVHILLAASPGKLLHVADRNGKATPLHLACWQGYSEIVEILVDHGAQVNTGDKDGDTVLHLAIGRRKSGTLFVKDTPNLQKLCNELNDPQITSPRNALLAYLIQHGSDVTIKNNAGKTPLDMLQKESALRRSLMKLAGIAPTSDDMVEQDEEPRKEAAFKEPRKEAAFKEPVEVKAATRTRGRTESGGDDFEGVHRIDPSELTLRETVGRGGFGEVKKAVWRGTMVAVKIISTAGSKQDEVEKEVFIHKRARHPNIVSLMAVGHEVGRALIVMEFIDGMDLYDVIFKKRSIVLTSELKLDITVGLLSALTYLHASKILHLDIKPSNVMIEKSSKRAYLCDLGLAHIKTRSSMSLSTSVRGPRGTITHMPPEMAQRDGNAWAGPGNDIWSMACTFLELFVEKRLWEGAEFIALMRQLLQPATVPPILKKASREVRQILEPCFDRKPLNRPSAESLLGKFQQLQQQKRQAQQQAQQQARIDFRA